MDAEQTARALVAAIRERDRDNDFVLMWADAEERIATALREAAAPAWRPIETAARDGAHFLAHDRETGQYECWWHDDWPRGESRWMDYADSAPEPTQWMPLPSPPSQGGGR